MIVLEVYLVEKVKAQYIYIYIKYFRST